MKMEHREIDVTHESETPRKILVAGSGIAGLSAAIAARKQDPSADITIISREKHLPYYRLRLCELIGKDTGPESLSIHPLKWYEDNRISLKLGCSVLSLHASPDSHLAATDGGDYPFDAMVVACGSTPVMPPFGGRELKGVHTLWTMDDIAAINSDLKTSRHAVVIGGGLLGLETAYCIRKMGIETTLVEGMPRLLPRQLDEGGSAIFTKKVESFGIHVVTGLSVKEFIGDSHVKEVLLADGSVFKADIVVVSVGVFPNTTLCSDSGIVLDRFVPVSNRMQVTYSANSPLSTLDSSMHSPASLLQAKISPDDISVSSLKPDKDSSPGLSASANTLSDSTSYSSCIYAAGDIASFNHEWFGQWPVASLQGQVAGANAAGGDATYVMTNSPYTLNTMETRVVVTGDVVLSAAGSSEALEEESVQKSDEVSCSYMKLVFKKSVLTGGILIGNAATRFVELQSLLKKKVRKEDIRLDEFLQF